MHHLERDLGSFLFYPLYISVKHDAKLGKGFLPYGKHFAQTDGQI
jgi:hypothetical protein